MAERATVARKTRVRFPPSTLFKGGKMKIKKINYKKIKDIIFVCKYNSFRSRVAEEYFKKINKNAKIRVMSRGIILGGDSDKAQRSISKKLLGINIAKRKPLPLNLQGMKKADLIIVVANDVPKVIFNYWLMPIKDKVIIWRIKDEQRMNEKNIKRIVLAIKRKVDKLNGKLSKG